MNRGIAALLAFGLLFAAALLWLRLTLPPPELPAIPELVPADTLAWFETRQPSRWLAGSARSVAPPLPALLEGLPIQALAAALLKLGPGVDGVEALLVAETSDPERVTDRLRARLPSPPWREQLHTQLNHRWSTFHRDGEPVLALYQAAGTVALSVGEGPLRRLVAERRRGAASLADRPAFATIRQGQSDDPFLWLDRERLAAALPPVVAASPGTPVWAVELGRRLELERSRQTPLNQ